MEEVVGCGAEPGGHCLPALEWIGRCPGVVAGFEQGHRLGVRFETGKDTLLLPETKYTHLLGNPVAFRECFQKGRGHGESSSWRILPGGAA